jgi:hypothetical protein
MLGIDPAVKPMIVRFRLGITSWSSRSMAGPAIQSCFETLTEG